MTYELGILVSLLLGIVSLVVHYSLRFSQYHTNLKQIGLYIGLISPINLSPTPWWGHILLVGHLLLLAPLFSWISVGSFILSIIWRMVRYMRVPQRVSDIKFVLGSCYHTPEKTKELFISLLRESGQSEDQINTLLDRLETPKERRERLKKEPSIWDPIPE